MGTIDIDKISLKITVVASCISALILFIFTALWSHEKSITRIDTNQIAVMKSIVTAELVPAQLARIETLMEVNTRDHAVILRELESMEKRRK